MIYFLHFRQQRLIKYAQQVAKQKAKAPACILTDDVRVSLMAVGNAYQMFSYHTKTPITKVLSYIPFTHEFKLRLIFSHSISNAHRVLQNSEKQIKELKPTPIQIGIRVISEPIHCTVNDPLPLPKVHPPLFTIPKNQKSNDNILVLFRNNMRQTPF